MFSESARSDLSDGGARGLNSGYLVVPLWPKSRRMESAEQSSSETQLGIEVQSRERKMEPFRLKLMFQVQPGEGVVLEYLLSLTKTMYKVQTKILNNQIIN